MPRLHRRRSTLLALVVCAVIATAFGLPPATASAHNSLVSSDPADGASLPEAPTQITWVFDNSVPLETLTVTMIDATGARSELAGSTHGSAGDTEVVTPLPALTAGPLSLRWRLVGPDGHPVTGRVDVTLTTASPANPPPTTDATATSVPTGDAVAGGVGTPALDTATSVDDGQGSSSTPSFIRWILRYGSYLAIMAVVGILLTSAYVWSGAGSHLPLRRVLSGALFATAALAFVQVLVVASDVSGSAPWSSVGSIDAATATDAGMALMIRIVLALTLWVVLFQYRIVHPDVYWTAVTFPALGLLATWAFAGHSQSMRWPTLGVLTDVAHHAAAAAWIAGLAIIGWIVIPRTAPDVLVPAVRRFSRVAAISVAVLVVTGLVQTYRLVGNPTHLLDADHGRYLAAKIVVLVVMLGLASANRRRVDARLGDTSTHGPQLGALRRAVVAEFAIGLVIVAITAAMVVSPPSTGETAIVDHGIGGATRRAPTDDGSALSYIL